MEDLIHFDIIKALKPNATDGLIHLVDIFGDEIYYINDYVCVGTTHPESDFIHFTAFEIENLGLDYWCDQKLSECEDFRKELDNITKDYQNDDAQLIEFTVLAEFHFESPADAREDGEEYDCCSEYLRVIK